MHPRELSISDFTYHLPEENIAYHPLPVRDQSRLLVYEGKIVGEDIYRNISSYLPENSIVVFNDTRVVEARLRFKKPTGGEIEIFCLEPGNEYADITLAMQQKGQVNWCCLIGGASKWKAGQVLEKKVNTPEGELLLLARFAGNMEGSFLVNLSWEPRHYSFAEVLHFAGQIPLPPYIKRAVESDDASRYQTVYAREEGSVAAPTAGLHFTEEILNSFQEKNIQTAFTTLHVGAGTFQPVKADTMEGHNMHAEFIEVSRNLIEQILNNPAKPVLAVGTTSLRTLESIYWLGVKAAEGKLDTGKGLSQWEIYDELPQHYSREMSLTALLEWMDKHSVTKLVTRTQLLIAPGYQVRMIKGLVTNFHQPSSTLLLLVASLVGPNWKDVYEEALRRNFRFLSYGDGMLILLDGAK